MRLGHPVAPVVNHGYQRVHAHDVLGEQGVLPGRRLRVNRGLRPIPDHWWHDVDVRDRRERDESHCPVQAVGDVGEHQVIGVLPSRRADDDIDVAELSGGTVADYSRLSVGPEPFARPPGSGEGAALAVVVDYPGRLHEGVHRGRADEAKAVRARFFLIDALRVGGPRIRREATAALEDAFGTPTSA